MTLLCAKCGFPASEHHHDGACYGLCERFVPPAISEKELSLAHKQAIDAMKDQLIIVLVKKLGGKVELPAAEIDNTEHLNLLMQLNMGTRTFTFEVREK